MSNLFSQTTHNVLYNHFIKKIIVVTCNFLQYFFSGVQTKFWTPLGGKKTIWDQNFFSNVVVHTYSGKVTKMFTCKIDQKNLDNMLIVTSSLFSLNILQFASNSDRILNSYTVFFSVLNFRIEQRKVAAHHTNGMLSSSSELKDKVRMSLAFKVGTNFLRPCSSTELENWVARHEKKAYCSVSLN